MGFLGVVNAYTMRICLSVAIIEMVKRNPSSGHDSELECKASEGSTPSVIKILNKNNFSKLINFYKNLGRR